VEDEPSWKPVLGISHGGRYDPATGLVLQVWGRPYQDYAIEASRSVGSWETLTAVSSANNGLSEHALANLNDERSFYRARAD